MQRVQRRSASEERGGGSLRSDRQPAAATPLVAPSLSLPAPLFSRPPTTTATSAVEGGALSGAAMHCHAETADLTCGSTPLGAHPALP